MNMNDPDQLKVLSTHIDCVTGRIWYSVETPDGRGCNLSPNKEGGWTAVRSGIRRSAPYPGWAIDSLEEDT